MLVAITRDNFRQRIEAEEEFSLTLYPSGREDSKVYVTMLVATDRELPEGFLVATISEWGDTVQHLSSETLANRLGLDSASLRADLAEAMRSIKKGF